MRKVAKALVAAGTSFVGTIGALAVQSNDSGVPTKASDYITAVIVAIVVGYGTWQVPNKDVVANG